MPWKEHEHEYDDDNDDTLSLHTTASVTYTSDNWYSSRL
jgi:hypothetical protein